MKQNVRVVMTVWLYPACELWHSVWYVDAWDGYSLTWPYHVCGRILRTNFLLTSCIVESQVEAHGLLLLPLYACRWEWLVYATIVSLLAKRCGYMTNFERSVFSKVILLILVRYFQIYILYSCFMGVTGKSLDIYLKLYIFCYCEIL